MIIILNDPPQFRKDPDIKDQNLRKWHFWAISTNSSPPDFPEAATDRSVTFISVASDQPPTISPRRQPYVLVLVKAVINRNTLFFKIIYE